MSIVPATIPFFNPEKYAGNWFSLASKPLIYERNCTTSSANYTYDKNTGQINLINTCVQADGSAYSRSGIARIPNYQDPGKLEIKFTDGLPADPGFQPYWIHWTDYDNYSIVGGPSGQFLWILGRQNQTSSADLIKLTKLIKTLGYNINDVDIKANLVV